jgi:iron complex transport system ATP-binding protein
MISNPTASTPLLRAHDLSAGHVCALFPPFDLSLHAGELVCLLGRNGAGKTSLLKTLGGILKPLHGSVDLQGVAAEGLPGRERALRAALLLTDTGLPPFLLGRELVALGRTPHGSWFSAARPEDAEAARAAMEQLHCTHLAERRLGELSDGERQRLCLARLLAQDAPVLLLDEPLAHMDLPAKAELLTLLRDWTRAPSSNGSGRTVLAAVHEVDLALGLADRCLMLIPGERPFIGSPEDAAGVALHRAFPGWPAFWNPLGLRDNTSRLPT